MKLIFSVPHEENLGLVLAIPLQEWLSVRYNIAGEEINLKPLSVSGKKVEENPGDLDTDEKPGLIVFPPAGQMSRH